MYCFAFNSFYCAVTVHSFLGLSLQAIVISYAKKPRGIRKKANNTNDNDINETKLMDVDNQFVLQVCTKI